ncbi:MAG: peptide deformylase [Mycobacteriales bacterium]
MARKPSTRGGAVARWLRKGAVRPIRYLGDPVLRTEADPVRSFDKEARKELGRLVDDMFASMYEAEGVGLAANQIGNGLAVFVYDCNDDDDIWHVGHLVNPRIVLAGGESITDPEGCLSVPGLRYDTTRCRHAVARGLTMDGEEIEVEGTGNFARCLQHEIDHLYGKVYIDRLEGDVRKQALRDIRAADWSTPAERARLP